MFVDKDGIARSVGRERYERGRAIAWAHAPDCGSALYRTETEQQEDTELFNIVGDVLDTAFAGAATNADKLRATCALYEDFPAFTTLSQLFMEIGFDGLTADQMTFFFRFLAAMLSRDAIEFARPAAYMLWVDFFEDDSRVEGAWNTVCEAISSDAGWRRLLGASGPVPEPLKLPVIERFRTDPSFHDAIFEALSASVFDIYGRIDRTTVEAILPTLHVDRSHESYHELLVRLANPAPIEFGWRLKD